MFSLKDKVTDKLSSLFSDSPSSPSPTLDQSKARSYSKEGTSLSSVFSTIFPSSSSDRCSPNKHSNDFKPIQSPPVKWKSRNLSWRNQMSDSYEEPSRESKENETPKPQGEDQDYRPGEGKIQTNRHVEDDLGCGRNTKCAKLSKDATGSYNLKSMPYLAEESSFISPDLYEFLLASIPNIVKGCQWVLLYSTLKHGVSLRTLIRRSSDLPGPCLLIVGDKQGAVFGGMLECPLRPTPKWKYQGTNQTFVFTTIYGEPRLFRPTGANRYFYLCLNDLIALGGGQKFALCLDGDLLIGKSGPSETFGNLCLAHNEEFELKNVELWGFTHSSRMLC